MKAWKLEVIFGVMVLCGACLADNLAGKKAPEITIREWITENPPNVKNLESRVYVVEFWATWCPPCIESIPHLCELNSKYKEAGVEFISLSQDKSADKVHRFVHQKNINYHVAVDNGTADWFGVRGYPTVAVVNHQGKVVWQGYPWNLEFEKAIIEAVDAGPPPLLAGVELGSFDGLKEFLWGGREFARAYYEIRSCADNYNGSEDCKAARRIIATIDKRISDKIRKADKLRETDLLKAYNIYVDIVTKYDGIEAVEPAKKAYLKLKNYKEFRDRPLVAKRTERTVE